MEYELYHYGVPGMKWGVRKTPQDRVNRYVGRQSAYVNKRSKRLLKRDERAVAKRRVKYDAALEKYGQGTKSQKAADKYVKAKAKMIANQKIAKAELNKLSKYTLSDVKAEKAHIGKEFVKRAFVVNAVNRMEQDRGRRSTSVPVDMYYTTKAKTNYRVGQQNTNEIRRKAMQEASRSIYGK